MITRAIQKLVDEYFHMIINVRKKFEQHIEREARLMHRESARLLSAVAIIEEWNIQTNLSTKVQLPLETIKEQGGSTFAVSIGVFISQWHPYDCITYVSLSAAFLALV